MNEGLSHSLSLLLEQQTSLEVSQCLAFLLDLADPVVQGLPPSKIYLLQAWLSCEHQMLWEQGRYGFLAW